MVRMVPNIMQNPTQAHTEALKMFQKTMHLNVSGEFDESTKSVMNKNRCGMKDMGEEGTEPRIFGLLSKFSSKAKKLLSLERRKRSNLAGIESSVIKF